MYLKWRHQKACGAKIKTSQNVCLRLYQHPHKLHSQNYSLVALKVAKGFLLRQYKKSVPEQKSQEQTLQKYNIQNKYFHSKHILPESLLISASDFNPKCYWYNNPIKMSMHCHKKRKDSLETQAEPAVFPL